MEHRERKRLFFGAATALATPFCGDTVDFVALSSMIEYQIASGIDALVLCGTTGEAATMSDPEWREVVRRGVEAVNGRVPCLIGCGSPDTARVKERAGFAAAMGADGLLVVTPYYNKGTREGILRHYWQVAEAGGLPTLLYHVPSRTGVRLSGEEICRIAEHPLLVGVKEASGDMGLFADLAAAIGGTHALYTGNDDLLLPSLALGGAGVISVVSNLLPGELARICRLFAEGELIRAREAHLSLLPLIRLLFRETNPAPLKYALSACGYCRGDLRLPLYTVEKSLREEIDATLRRLQK